MSEDAKKMNVDPSMDVDEASLVNEWKKLEGARDRLESDLREANTRIYVLESSIRAIRNAMGLSIIGGAPRLRDVMDACIWATKQLKENRP